MSQTSAEFTTACRTFSQMWSKVESPKNHWDNVQIVESFGDTWIRISASVLDQPSSRPQVHQHIETFEDQVYEDDLEVVHKNSSAQKRKILYDIVRSPSYQVPVLYISLHDENLLSSEEMFDLVVPAVNRTQIRDVGVMGALSITQHPILGTPAFFVHPCRTGEAMQNILNGQVVAPERYLMLWLGLTGTSVGLSLPVELAQSMSELSLSGERREGFK